MDKKLVITKQLPLIPEDWEYEDSVTYLKPKVESWKKLTIEIATELYIAREKLSRDGRPPKTGTIVPVFTWAEYCEGSGRFIFY